VAQIAAAQDAVLRRTAPPALDLALPAAYRQLAAWLG
jgi:hypothetical protein